MNEEELLKLFDDMLYGDEPTQQVDSNKCDGCNIYLTNDDGMNVCPNCGIVYGYDFVNEYAIYDRCTIHQKSIYKRKTHLSNVLLKYNIKRVLWDEIISLFCKMERLFEKDNDIDRKNMISYNVMIRGILWKQHRYQEAKKIPLLKTKKTRIIHCEIFYKLWDIMNIE